MFFEWRAFLNNIVLKNASWILVCKMLQSLLSFIIGLFTARYLGPSNYGLISYASSTVAFFIPIMQLGLNSTLIQEFIEKPEKEGEILGTSLVFNILSAVVSIIGVASFSLVANRGEVETILVCFLYSLTLFFRATEMVQYWFQSHLLSKYPSIVSLIAYGIISIYKIYILVAAKDIEWFAVIHVIESAIVSILLLVVYMRIGGKKLSFSFQLGKQMLSKSKYYITANLMVVLFSQTDKIMLKNMVGKTETGFYSAAYTCIGIASIIYSALIDSMRPYILSGKKESNEVFESRLSLLFSSIAIISLLQSVIMTVFSKQIVLVLFGVSYSATVLVLQILVWQVLFGYLGSVRNIWILAEGKQKHLWKINLMGALINVLGNAFLIPIMGARGASIASVLTQILTNFILCFIIKSMRPFGRIIIRSLHPKTLVETIKMMKQIIVKL